MRFFQQTRGSALVMVMIVTAGLSLVLITVLKTTSLEYRLTHEHIAALQAYHLSEGCIEVTISDLSKMDDLQDLKDAGWQVVGAGDYLVREFTPLDLGWQTASVRQSTIRVMMDDPTAVSTVRIWSKAEVGNAGSLLDPQEVLLNIELEVTDEASTTTYPYIGIITAGGFQFNGKPSLDSYDSSVFPYSYAEGINSGSNAVIATTSSEAGAIDLGNGSLEGNVYFPGDSADNAISSSFANISGSMIGDFSFGFAPVVIPTTEGAETSF